MVIPVPAILPIHTARHEAAHAVLAWLVGVPFDTVSFGQIPETNYIGGMLQNAGAEQWARARIGNRNNVFGQMLIRLLAVSYVAELVDVHINILPPAIAGARAGAPAPGRQIAGDYAIVQQYLNGYNVQIPAHRLWFEQHAQAYAQTLVNKQWFRAAVIAVGNRLISEPGLQDNQVGETISSSAQAVGRIPVPSDPPEDEIQVAAYYRWLATGSVFESDVIHWHTARKGMRYLRSCGG